ncbi:MAG: TIGR02444 family protein [Alphaproteobacteria bacterium]|nr:TIGR02444 family protein [Alphaproteobacteria bacterium]
MTPSTAPSSDQLWDFALAVYRCDGVPPACLHLQDQCAVDVPLLLAAGFAACTARRFDRAAYDALHYLADDWQQQIVSALRVIRRRLKTGPQPAPTITTESLRDKIKSAELAAEKIQIDVMQNAIDGLAGTAGPATRDQLLSVLTMVVAVGNEQPLSVADNQSIALIADSMIAVRA